MITPHHSLFLEQDNIYGYMRGLMSIIVFVCLIRCLFFGFGFVFVLFCLVFVSLLLGQGLPAQPRLAIPCVDPGGFAPLALSTFSAPKTIQTYFSSYFCDRKRKQISKGKMNRQGLKSLL